MLGDLTHALSMASYQVWLSRLMRWNILPVAGFILLGLLYSEKPVWAIVLILILFSVLYYASGWEHNIYVSKKRELEILQKKLTDTEVINSTLL